VRSCDATEEGVCNSDWWPHTSRGLIWLLHFTEIHYLSCFRTQRVNNANTTAHYWTRSWAS